MFGTRAISVNAKNGAQPFEPHSVYMDLDISKLMDYFTSSNIESAG